MAHYDCSCCGESYGISHKYCSDCQAGLCHRSQNQESEKAFMPNPLSPFTIPPELAAATDVYDYQHGALQVFRQPTNAYDYEVKSWPQFFGPMLDGTKKHDMRNKRDRQYRVGDKMLLREFDPFGGGYTGRSAIFKITYITSNETPCALSSAGLDDEMAILSVQLVAVAE
ncbi:hypothetical protein LAV_00068 [Sphingobium phage Lacusarx]|uniref:DUF3850 domain-containing protein n=1 Tax=Sphingobium phage Lacusarx TaxID=1980139 RepID=A0A1W6DX24_9CAUD|nr:RNA-binding protein [Sphingobium phage Lacusarx]ARK07468.1 hypothetical protein LAV_00068 [Sphingobium phage Lacusarx]